MKHTPGPWTADAIVTDHGGWKQQEQFVHILTDDKTIAHFSTSATDYPSDEENVANAHLIAAAPELLEALERLVGVVNISGFRPKDPEFVAYENAVAAIAKARGERSATSAQADNNGGSAR